MSAAREELAGGPLPNPKHEAFAAYYVSGKTRGNASASYIKAGYKSRGAAAYAAASRLLRRPEIRARIRELRNHETNRD